MIQRRWILPTLVKRRLEISDCGPADLELDVVPRGPGPVPLVQLDRLFIAVMLIVVASSVTEVDAAHERHVLIGSATAPDQDQLLVMGSAAAHSFIEQHLTARLRDLLGESSVLLGAKGESIAVRTPQQTSHVDAFSTGLRDEVPHRRTTGEQTLVAVTAPVGEPDLVAAFERPERLRQLREVRCSVDQKGDVVVLGPSDVAATTSVDLGGRIAPFLGSQKPIVEAHWVSPYPNQRRPSSGPRNHDDE